MNEQLDVNVTASFAFFRFSLFAGKEASINRILCLRWQRSGEQHFFVQMKFTVTLIAVSSAGIGIYSFLPFPLCQSGFFGTQMVI